MNKAPEGREELYALVKPINPRFIEPPPQGKSGHYVPHFVISQIILGTVGPYDWELVDVLRGHVPGMTAKSGREYPPMPNAVIGVVYRMGVVIDGKAVSIEEAGSCDAGAYEDNDAERMKKASSDALKRCAMRLGIGIHLWCKRDDQYIVRNILEYHAGVADHGLEETTQAVTGVEGQEEDA